MAAATASDGLGSIRIPAACNGLFGLKPQYGRVPTAPKGDDAWHGIVHYGTLTRSVRDTALFLDAVADRPSWGTFAEAAERPPGSSRRGVDEVPPPIMAPLDPRGRRGGRGHGAAAARASATRWSSAIPDYDAAAMARGMARYFRGILDDAAATEHPERLARRTKAMARIGRLIPGSVLARSLAETARAHRAPRAACGTTSTCCSRRRWPRCRSRSAPTRAAVRCGPSTAPGASCPHLGIWNMTGQPAASVPAGFTPEGVPLAVHLVARSGDEATLMSLSAQIEAERPWADRRPAIAS